MAKYKRLTIGSICKPKEEGTPDYFKVRGDTAEDFAKALLKMDRAKGKSLKLESKNYQLNSLNQAVADGKLSPEMAEKAKERINKIPDYVRFEVILLSEAEA